MRITTTRTSLHVRTVPSERSFTTARCAFVVVVFPFSLRRSPEPRRNVSMAAVRGALRPSIHGVQHSKRTFILY